MSIDSVCAILNHRKKMKPEPSGLILRTITANLDLLIVFLGLIRYYKTKLKHLSSLTEKTSFNVQRFTTIFPLQSMYAPNAQNQKVILFASFEFTRTHRCSPSNGVEKPFQSFTKLAIPCL